MNLCFDIVLPFDNPHVVVAFGGEGFDITEVFAVVEHGDARRVAFSLRRDDVVQQDSAANQCAK